MNDIASIFSEKYNKSSWGGGSGIGSMTANTVHYRSFLTKFINENKIKSILDIGCGDWEIMKYVPMDGINYIGYDCVNSVIEQNKKLYPSFPFICADVSKGKLIHQTDLVIIKDVFEHLSFLNIKKVLDNLPDYSFLIVVGDTLSGDVNSDIDDGGYRTVDYQELLRPIEKILTYELSYKKHAGRTAANQKDVFVKYNQKVSVC